ncbi:MAG: hypothetical protein AB7E96_01850 [Deferribacterales bacterium]
MRKLVLVALMFLTCVVSYAMAPLVDVGSALSENSTDATGAGYDISSDGTIYGIYVGDGGRILDFTNNGTVDLTRDHYDSNGTDVYTYGLYFDSQTGVSLVNNAGITLRYTVDLGGGLVYSGYQVGIYDATLSGNLTNYGTIDITTSYTGAGAQLNQSDIYGIQLTENFGTLISSGGIYIQGETLPTAMQTMSVQFSDMYGIYNNGNTIDSVSVNNDIYLGFAYNSVATGTVSVSNVSGVEYDGGSAFTNSANGDIESYFSTTGSVITQNLSVGSISGVNITGSLSGAFANNGIISSAFSIDSPDFQNHSNISVSSIEGALVYGAASITNTNEISVSGSILNTDTAQYPTSIGVSGVYGLYVGSDGAGTVSNSGDISAALTVEDSTAGYASLSDIYGAYVDGNVTTAFTNINGGTISSSVTFDNTDLNGDDSGRTLAAENVYGVFLAGDTASFVNNGTISSGLTVRGASGNNVVLHAELYTDNVVGAHIETGTSIVNSGSITSDTVLSYIDAGAVNLNGAYALLNYSGIDSFTNLSGTIRAKNSLTGVTTTSDMVIDTVEGAVLQDVTSFRNFGTITAYNSLSNVSVGGDLSLDTVYGAIANNNNKVLDFRNDSVISGYNILNTVHSDGDMKADAFYGLGLYYLDTFANTGTISASFTASNITSDGVVEITDGYGLETADMNSFTNSGTVSTSVGISTGSSVGRLYIDYFYGAYLGAIPTFTNDGTMSASVNISDFDSSDEIDIYSVYALFADGQINSFTNNQNIRVSVSVSDSTADLLYISGLYGIYYNDTVASIDNNGSISVSLSDTDGTYGSTSYVGSVYALYSYEVTDMTNDGTISVSVASDSETEFRDISAAYLYQIDNFTNNGDIRLTVNGASGSTTDTVSAMEANSSTITINNPGEVYIESNFADADIRTLRVVNSDATFGDYFTIAAGGFEGSENVGAIYVDSHSSLDINNAILGVTMNSHLALNTAYKVIENDNGIVDGTFSGLRPFTNADYTLAWATSERGEDAEVTISYDPKESAPAHTVASVAGAMGVVSNLFSGRALSGSFFSGGGAGGGAGGGFGGFSGFSGDVSYLGASDILLADSGEIATDAGLSYVPAKKKSSVFAFPFYSKQSGDGYDSKTSGMGVGFARRFMDGVTGTAYLGRMSTDTDYDSASMDKTESDSTFLGAALNYDKGIYASASLIGFMTDNNYEGYNGADNEFSESADYSSKGMQMELTGGYSFKLAQGVRVVPFGGLSLSYYDMDAYNTDVAGTANDAYNTYYDSYSDWDTSLIAGVSAEKNIKLASGALKVFGQYRYDIAIGNNDIVINQSVPGLNTGDLSVEQSVDNGTHKLGLGTEFSKVNWYTSAYGEYSANADYDSMSFKLTAGYKF